MTPLTGLVVRAFPDPGLAVRSAREQLQLVAIEPPADQAEVRELAQMPRPWDPPVTCFGALRAELWVWLDLVAMWINEEHPRTVSRPGIPECWPAHPHVAYDLAVLACSRYFTSSAVTLAG